MALADERGAELADGGPDRHYDNHPNFLRACHSITLRADHRWPTGPKVPFLVGGNHEGRSRPGASDCPEGPVTWE